mgnify:CR=1 FL=1
MVVVWKPGRHVLVGLEAGGISKAKAAHLLRILHLIGHNFEFPSETT